VPGWLGVRRRQLRRCKVRALPSAVPVRFEAKPRIANRAAVHYEVSWGHSHVMKWRR
jgi:hypothetical protein